MKKYVPELLECPVCLNQLNWQIASENQNRIEQAEAHYSGCEAMYPVRDGIGIFLTPDLPRNDTWEHVDNQVVLYLRDHPDIEKQLMEVPAEKLSPPINNFVRWYWMNEGNLLKERKLRTLQIKICTQASTCLLGTVSLNMCLKVLRISRADC